MDLAGSGSGEEHWLFPEAHKGGLHLSYQDPRAWGTSTITLAHAGTARDGADFNPEDPCSKVLSLHVTGAPVSAGGTDIV